MVLVPWWSEYLQEVGEISLCVSAPLLERFVAYSYAYAYAYQYQYQYQSESECE